MRAKLCSEATMHARRQELSAPEPGLGSDGSGYGSGVRLHKPRLPQETSRQRASS